MVGKARNAAAANRRSRESCSRADRRASARGASARLEIERGLHYTTALFRQRITAMADTLKQHVTNALSFAQGQVRRLVENHPGFYPLYTDQGKWKHEKPAWTRWCDGFLPGMMWLFLESGLADDPSYWRKKAEEYSQRLEERKEDRDVHDLGFIFYHGTYKRWYE